jgi:hypothetical protein
MITNDFSFLMSVRPSVAWNTAIRTGRIFMFSCWGFFLKYVHTLQFWLKSEKIKTFYMKIQVRVHIRSPVMKGLHG